MEPLKITAKCPGNDRWLYLGGDLLFDVVITNTSLGTVGFPLEFVQKTGPEITLIDTRTKAEVYPRPNLADLDLKEKFTDIAPGGTVSIQWVLKGSEIEGFHGLLVDLSAKITVTATIRVSGEKKDFRGTDIVRIVSPPKP